MDLKQYGNVAVWTLTMLYIVIVGFRFVRRRRVYPLEIILVALFLFALFIIAPILTATF